MNDVRTDPAVRSSRESIIDCDIHPMMKSGDNLKRYLPKKWHEFADCFSGSAPGEAYIGAGNYPEVSPHISRRDAYPPAGGPPGSDLAFMQDQLLDAHNIEFGILQVLSPGGSNQRNIQFGAAVCTAVNDWQVAEWTSCDSRLKGSIVVAQEDAASAVAEIARCAPIKGFAQVGLIQRSLEPIGRQRYRSIIAAAVEHDLPIGVHTGGRNGHPPMPGSGWASYTIEQQTLTGTGMQSLVTSLVMEGVLEEFPRLRVCLIEGGFSWLPSLTWRLDKLWERSRAEVPHVKRPPSEYIREHFWLSTQPVEPTDDPAHLRDIFDLIGWDRLCFASDYPHWDFDDPRYAFPFDMTPDEKRKIYYENSKRLYNL